MFRAPCGVERFPPRAVKKADQSEGADNEQRPLQYFGTRRVRAKVIKQCQIRERPKRNEARPVKQNGAEGYPRQLVQLPDVPGALRSNIRPVNLGIWCQWMSVRHDPVRKARGWVVVPAA
jgi:hypothetical protein